ncbi:hypothetical protein Tco_1102947 [Tanacetum coccineum]
MAQLLPATHRGYLGAAILIPEIVANNFELRHGLINLVQNKQFFGHDKEDPHAHIRYFNKITSTMRVPNVPTAMISLMLLSFSTRGAAPNMLERRTLLDHISNLGHLHPNSSPIFLPSSLKRRIARTEITNQYQQRIR